MDAPPLSELATATASAEQGSAPLDFALCLALNHTVVLEEDPKTGKKQMQAESPDEEALVDGGKVRFFFFPLFLPPLFPPSFSHCCISGKSRRAVLYWSGTELENCLFLLLDEREMARRKDNLLETKLKVVLLSFFAWVDGEGIQGRVALRSLHPPRHARPKDRSRHTRLPLRKL